MFDTSTNTWSYHIPEINEKRSGCKAAFNKLILLLHTRKTIFLGLINNPNSTTALLKLSDILHSSNNEQVQLEQLSGKSTSEGGKSTPPQSIINSNRQNRKLKNEEFQKILNNIPKCLDCKKINISKAIHANHMSNNDGKQQSLDSLLNGPTKIFGEKLFPMN